MNNRLVALVIIALAATFSIASEPHGAKQTQEDIARHRAIAAAQTLAAQCLGANSDSTACAASLKTNCAGLAIGKYCGLKQESWLDAVKSLTLTARAHQTAAQCFESGKAYENCLWDLQTACKGLAVGKNCGMVHAHSF